MLPPTNPCFDNKLVSAVNSRVLIHCHYQSFRTRVTSHSYCNPAIALSTTLQLAKHTLFSMNEHELHFSFLHVLEITT